MAFRSLIRTFAGVKSVRHWFVWLSRLHHCRGFGIQSPTDYAFVRYVINEHWPYYAYTQLNANSWTEQKMGRLYFRLANWRQPKVMQADRWQQWLQAGCKKTRFISSAPANIELASASLDDAVSLFPLCNGHSVVIVEDIYRDWNRWKTIILDERVGVSFDLYYCGILFFDKNRYKQNYVINF